MRWSTWATAALAVLVLVGAAAAADSSQVRDQVLQKKIVTGSTPRDVRSAIGEPTKITRRLTYWETVETWTYGEGQSAVAIIFENGKLKRVTDGGRSILN